MTALIKKDLLLTLPIITVMSLFLVIMTLIDVPAVFIMLVGMMAGILSPFTYDEKNKTNLFLFSLPVSKRQIVVSRFVYSLLVLTAVLFIQGISWLIADSLAVFSPAPYEFHDFIVFFAIGLLIISAFYPILYFFNNSYQAMLVILILISAGTFFTMDPIIHILNMNDTIVFNGIDKGFALLIEKYIPFQPYFLLFLLSAGICICSMRCSEWMLKRKDI